MTSTAARIGLIGFGTIGSHVFKEILENPGWGLEIGFVHDADPVRLKRIPEETRLERIEEFGRRGVDLVVEMAHADVTRMHGERVILETDYMPLSLTALADAALLDRLLAAAQARGTRLFAPHGAAVGVDSLFECRDLWENVTVVMKKNPKNLDFSAAPDWKGRTITEETLLYDGPTRGVCPLYPRNVNAHAAVALAGVGFDRTRSVLIADPGLDVSVIEIEARGQGGVHMRIERSNPLTGVSGVFTLRAILSCILRARGTGAGLQVC